MSCFRARFSPESPCLRARDSACRGSIRRRSVGGLCGSFCCGFDFDYFSIRDNGIAWSTTALGIHSLPPSLVATTRTVPVTRILAQASGYSNRLSAILRLQRAVFASADRQTTPFQHLPQSFELHTK